MITTYKNHITVFFINNIDCRDGSYSYAMETISLANVTLEDSGFYYCTVHGPEDETRAASLQLQVHLVTSSPARYTDRTMRLGQLHYSCRYIS